MERSQASRFNLVRCGMTMNRAERRFDTRAISALRIDDGSAESTSVKNWNHSVYPYIRWGDRGEESEPHPQSKCSTWNTPDWSARYCLSFQENQSAMQP